MVEAHAWRRSDVAAREIAVEGRLEKVSICWRKIALQSQKKRERLTLSLWPSANSTMYMPGTTGAAVANAPDTQVEAKASATAAHWLLAFMRLTNVIVGMGARR